MTIKKVTRTFSDIHSQEILSDGRHVIFHKSDGSFYNWDVKVPIRVNGNQVTIYVSEITGKLGRVDFDSLPVVLGGKETDAEDLKRQGVTKIAFFLNDEISTAFHIHDNLGPSIEYEPDEDSAIRGHFSKEMG
ncbi:hypothetical protein A2154_03780 [Candidatus Gottesmanbacteria bacterium RBG_16_43_7]|uniref:Uncharacterized protein n=1 Tax=Candidatus Gottesmanbacteria bacterium RBG_16_43_7 TaxID=1798373 RepID=A0A1F5Z8R2_9BACT|nr:MAG: hypothetical protein A2154_03780 [Candidatus Gottesmanbacteria bacterium RBG_16_43_7]